MSVGLVIADLDLTDERAVHQTAALLVAGLPHGWPELEAAKAEVVASLDGDGISRVGIVGGDNLVGWIAAHPE